MPEETTKYKVLCWGACGGDEANPCGIEYLSTEGAVWKRATTGDVIEDILPAHVRRQKWIEHGILVPLDADGTPVPDALEKAVLRRHGYTIAELAAIEAKLGGDDK